MLGLVWLKIAVATLKVACKSKLWECSFRKDFKPIVYIHSTAGIDCTTFTLMISDFPFISFTWVPFPSLLPFSAGAGNSDRDAKADSSGSWWEHQKVAGDASKQRRWWAVHLLAFTTKGSDEITNFYRQRGRGTGTSTYARGGSETGKKTNHSIILCDTTYFGV